MKYLKVFVDFADRIELLSDIEAGRLFRAMLSYAAAGTEAHDLKGNERFLWSSVKGDIDRQRETYGKRCEANARNIGVRWENTNRYESIRNDTKKYESYQEKEKDKDKDKEKEKEKKEKKKEKSDAFAAFAAGDSDLLSVLKDFESMRKQIKKPMTERAKTNLCRKLEREFSPELWIAVIEQSISHCWADVYALKNPASVAYSDEAYNSDNVYAAEVAEWLKRKAAADGKKV